MNKYLEHLPVEAPFWDISNKLKDFGFSKGEFITTKSIVKMSLHILAGVGGVRGSSQTCFTCEASEF